MPNIFQWDSYYSVDVDSFDREHKKLFEMFYQNYNCSEAERSDPELQNKLVQGLIQYIRDHFRKEEHAMVKFNYPFLERHRAKHHELVKMVVALQKRLNQDESLEAAELSRFLAKWLRFHIQNEDMKYAGFMIEHGVQ